MNKQYTVELQENAEGDLVLELPEEIIQQLKWREGDVLEWVDNHDGSYIIKYYEK